jgi:hypothetical protein
MHPVLAHHPRRPRRLRQLPPQARRLRLRRRLLPAQRLRLHPRRLLLQRQRLPWSALYLASKRRQREAGWACPRRLVLTTHSEIRST